MQKQARLGWVDLIWWTITQISNLLAHLSEVGISQIWCLAFWAKSIYHLWLWSIRCSRGLLMMPLFTRQWLVRHSVKMPIWASSNHSLDREAHSNSRLLTLKLMSMLKGIPTRSTGSCLHLTRTRPRPCKDCSKSSKLFLLNCPHLLVADLPRWLHLKSKISSISIQTYKKVRMTWLIEIGHSLAIFTISAMSFWLTNLLGKRFKNKSWSRFWTTIG